MSGLNGIMLGIGIGFLRNLKIDANIPMENVCGDYVTNGTLAAIWHENLAKPVEAKIVNITHKGRKLKVGEREVLKYHNFRSSNNRWFKALWLRCRPATVDVRRAK